MLGALTICTHSHCKLSKNSSAYINKRTHSNMPMVGSSCQATNRVEQQGCLDSLTESSVEGCSPESPCISMDTHTLSNTCQIDWMPGDLIILGGKKKYIYPAFPHSLLQKCLLESQTVFRKIKHSLILFM